MSTKTLFLNDKLYEYMLSISLRESSVLRELRLATQQLSSSVMQIAPEQGQFFSLLVQLMQVKNALEIGVYTGYSSLSVAMAMPEDGRLLACDVNDEWTDMARTFWRKANVEHKIELKIAPALETLDALITQKSMVPFDFVFIDADKGNYINYYERSLKLTRPGGLIVFDNIFRDGDVINKNAQGESITVIRELNQKLLQDDRIDLSVLPIGDGLTLARKR